MQTYDPPAGTLLPAVFLEMVGLANRKKESVRAEINGITLTVEPNSNIMKLADRFYKERSRREKDYLASPEAKKEPARRIEFKKNLKQARERGFLPFSIKDKKAWQRYVGFNQDMYGADILRFASRWAKLMEKEMSLGAKLADIADKTAGKADLEGMSGHSMYLATAVLARVWEHGEDLWKWHLAE